MKLTNCQDPADRFSFIIEELRRIRGAHSPVRGAACLVVSMILDLVTQIIGQLVGLAEEVRVRKLVVVATVPDPEVPFDWARIRPPERATLLVCTGTTEVFPVRVRVAVVRWYVAAMVRTEAGLGCGVGVLEAPSQKMALEDGVVLRLKRCVLATIPDCGHI